MNHSCDGGPGLSSNGNDDLVREVPNAASASGDGNDSDARFGFDSVGSAIAVDRVSVSEEDRSDELRGSDAANVAEVVKLESEESRPGDGSGEALEKQPSSSESENNKKKTDPRTVKMEQKKLKPVVEDYDSILSEFDQFASKGVGEAVGYGYEIGDMVWGKVKSHPWWPGYIYNEAFAAPHVWKTKRNGHVLVAFFGDSSYGWFELAELVPFAENFAEKSRQTTSRGFVKAVEEAVGEFSRRRSLALACRCRNEFNFWPSKVEGYYVVDVGDYEPGIYSLSQIHKARENFQPKEMLSFVDDLALKPRTNQHGTIEFIKNRATVLACRRAMFEEFDETYAQAFGTTPERPQRPTMPVAVDPAKAPLSGPLVFAEALGKGKALVKPTKIKEQMEDKYIFKRRDEPVPMTFKKAIAGQASSPAHPFLVDGSGLSGMLMESSTKGPMHQISISFMNDSQLQAISNQASIISDVRPPEGSRKIIQGGIKKMKVKKQHIGESSTGNPALIEKKKRKKDANAEQLSGGLSPASVNLVKKKKRKKEIKNETSAHLVQLPDANSNRGLVMEKGSGMLVDVPLIVNHQLDTTKDLGMSTSATIEKQQAGDLGKLDFPMLLNDLCALALNPFHGAQRGCPATAQQVFLKFRSLVYQKSLGLFPSENEKSEALSTTALRVPTEKPKDKPKLMKPPGRADDPTKGGRKRGPSDFPEAVKKKKLLNSQDSDKKKRIDSEGIKKKKIVGDMKSISIEKKAPQRPTEIPRENVKAVASKNVTSASSKGLKPESLSRRTDGPTKTPNKPTMLVMKFPTGAALPSSAELRAKFTRFGPMDHSATRVFWKSYTCRLVFRQKADADAALAYARATNNLFGNTNVRSFTREVEAEAPEPEPVRALNEQSIETSTAARTLVQQPLLPTPQQQQLKSCLKKPVGEENTGNGNGNNGRGTRVKFVLGEEGSNSSKAEQQVTTTSSTTTSVGSYAHSMDVSSKNLAKLITPESSSSQRLPINMMSMGMPRRQPPNNDISQQFLNLLTRCSDVVNSLTGALGYVPYHSL